MKKIFPTIVAICLVVPTMLFLGSNFSVSKAEKPIRQNSALTNIFGEVWVQPAGDGDLVPATEGMTLNTGDIVFSGESSSVNLTYFDGSETLIFPDTVLEISEMSARQDGSGKVIQSYQWLGRTLNRVEKLLDTESRYEIETPNAVTAVRGTQYSVVVGEDGTTQVDVIEGIVDVTSQGETVKVKEKQATSVHPGEKPVEVFPSVINPNDANDGNDKDGNAGGGNDEENKDGNPNDEGKDGNENDGNAGGGNDGDKDCKNKNDGKDENDTDCNAGGGNDNNGGGNDNNNGGGNDNNNGGGNDNNNGGGNDNNNGGGNDNNNGGGNDDKVKEKKK